MLGLLNVCFGNCVCVVCVWIYCVCVFQKRLWCLCEVQFCLSCMCLCLFSFHKCFFKKNGRWFLCCRMFLSCVIVVTGCALLVGFPRFRWWVGCFVSFFFVFLLIFIICPCWLYILHVCEYCFSCYFWLWS